MNTIHITHYSDILCVWAYIAQIRIEELQSNFKEQVELNFCLFPVFGDVHQKMENVWANKGGIKAYNQHVVEVAQQFEHADVHEDIWLKATPHSSLPSHLFLLATKLLEAEGTVPAHSFARLAKQIRQAFFAELKDVSNHQVLAELVLQTQLPLDAVEQKINSGQAYAALATDAQNARDLAIRSSPTLLFNDDRQRLAGNIGYRIIEANIKELIDRPDEQQTWC